MIEIGSEITGIVSRLERYGLYLEHNADVIFVPLGNLSWTPSGDPLNEISVGDTCNVVILRFDDKKRLYAGSVKHLRSEENPYRFFSTSDTNAIYEGIVTLIHQNGFTVSFENGCVGEVQTAADEFSIEEGKRVQVRVVSLDVDEERLVLALVDD